MQLLLGSSLAIIISYFAWRLHSLTIDGALAAACLGAIVFGLGGWQWAAIMLIFFTSSSIFSFTFKNSKRTLLNDYSKGSRRDAAQVLSNGGIAGLFVLLHLLYMQAQWPWLAYVSSLAAVNADTWATELGILDRNNPRLIIDLNKPVEKGTSGAISLVGTLAAVIGSLAIAIPAAAFANPVQWSLCVLITFSGLFGSLIDSFIGATVQGIYFCPTDVKETEKFPQHSCGTPTIHIRGWRWLNNDWVNVACSAFGALAILPLASLLR